jgi:pimeloyl-ACP methyl ester carboxylesterase
MDTTTTVLLVHGAWADGSSWRKVIPLLQAASLRVVAVQLPLTSLADDAAAVKRAIALEEGPVLLAGHSYGGAVISEAGDDAKVVGLIYVAAFAPNVGQSAGSLGASVPPAPLAAEATPDAFGFVKLTHAGVFDCFAQDLSNSDREILFTVQGPTSVKSLGGTATVAAWKSRPSYYIEAKNDRAIPPQLQRTMAATIKARVTAVETSHLVMLAAPEIVAKVIIEASRTIAQPVLA